MIVQDLDKATELICSAVALFNEDTLNMLPPSGWTAGQVLEHVLLVESWINRMLVKNGGAAEAGRLPDKKQAMISAALVNDETRYQSPEPFLPSEKPQNKKLLLKALLAERQKLATFISSLTPEEAAVVYKHSQMGYLSKYEWAHFIAEHSNRHTRQLQKIAVIITAENRLTEPNA